MVEVDQLIPPQRMIRADSVSLFNYHYPAPANRRYYLFLISDASYIVTSGENDDMKFVYPLL